MRAVVCIILILVVCACGKQNKKEKPRILVFCAASLTNIVSEIAEEFEEYYDADVQLNFASSGTLARQIEHGANPSLFLSANKVWINYLNHIGKTQAEYERKVVGNSLVVISPKNGKVDFINIDSGSDFPKTFEGRLSIGDPKHVPAGDYAMQAIERMGCKSELEMRLLPAKDVRSALLVVELGEAEAGIVYRTDALKSGKVKIITEIPGSYHSPIAYYLSVLKGNNDKTTQLFYDFLNSKAVEKIWIKYGFIVENE